MLVKYETQSGIEHTLECAHKVIDPGGFPAPYVHTVTLCEIQSNGKPADHELLLERLPDSCQVIVQRVDDEDDTSPVRSVSIEIELLSGEHIWQESIETGKTVGHHRSGEDYGDDSEETVA